MRPIEDDVIHSYTHEFDESKRLSTGIGPLESARTKELLLRFLPASPAVVLDVGGATGPYSFWLASLGYRIHLLDIVPVHIAKAESTQANPDSPKLAGIHLGDARELPFSGASADAVSIHGPLYHLPDRGDRIRCLAEAKRVLKPTGRLLAFGITRYAGLLYTITKGSIFDPQTLTMIRSEVQTGRRLRSAGERTCFKSAYFHLRGGGIPCGRHVRNPGASVAGTGAGAELERPRKEGRLDGLGAIDRRRTCSGTQIRDRGLNGAGSVSIRLKLLASNKSLKLTPEVRVGS